MLVVTMTLSRVGEMEAVLLNNDTHLMVRFLSWSYTVCSGNCG